MAIELGQLSRGLLKPAYGAGESLAAPGEADSAVQSARLELGLLASLANDPGASFFLLHDVDCIATLEGPPRFRLCRLCAMCNALPLCRSEPTDSLPEQDARRASKKVPQVCKAPESPAQGELWAWPCGLGPDEGCGRFTHGC